jgi:threonine dehydratase
MCVDNGKSFSYAKGISMDIKNLIDKMLRKNANERPTINEVFEMLKKTKEEPIDGLSTGGSGTSPIGGGGLIAGITIAAKNINPNIKIIGVQAEGAHAMVESLKKGERVILSAKTLADGIQVKEPGQTPFEILKEYAETLVTVSESEIHNAMIYLFEKHHAIVEGAGAVSLAAFMNGKINKDHKKICLVCSGGNIDIGVFSRLIDRVLLKQKRRVHFDVEIPDRIGEFNKLLTIISGLNINIYHCVTTRQILSSDLMYERINITLEFQSLEQEKKVIQAFKDGNYKYTIY